MTTAKTCRRPPFAFCILHFALHVFSLSAACGAKRIPLPSDPGSPLPNYSEIHAEVTKSCRGARTLTAELGLRGRAGTRRLSGRLIAGFERPASMRLEAVAPFGPAGFILVTRGEQAVLLLPRDERVVRGESAEAILGALTGVTLGPADLQAILTGCILPESKPSVAGCIPTGGPRSISMAARRCTCAAWARGRSAPGAATGGKWSTRCGRAPSRR